MQGLAAGQKFERYRVLRFLGNGISGESYEAEDTSLQRIVLLKLIHPWLILSDPIRRQFFRDMQYISTITHPYLAEILDYGETDSQLYMVRSYTSPGSLLNNEGRARFNPPLPPTNAITYTYQLAQALQHLHDYGLTHGSLTFSNVMVVHSATHHPEHNAAPFLLADPGIACFVRRFGLPKITLLPVSAAPEHLEKHFIPAGDQYALATLLYFWLAGRPPFLGPPDMLLQQKLTETITPLTLFNSNVSARQEEVVRRALSCTPEKRYPSILAFAEALADSLQPSAHTILPDETTPRLSHTSRFTNTQSVMARLENTPQPEHHNQLAEEQHTDELPQLTQETQPADSDEQVEILTPQEHSQDKSASTSSDLESLMASLLQTNPTTPPPSPYYHMSEADNQLDTEPALNDELITEWKSQGYLSGRLDAEIHSKWNRLILQESPELRLLQIEPEQPPAALPQPLPESMQTSPAKPVVPSAQPASDQIQTHDAQKTAPHLLITSHYLSEPREVFLENELITIGRAGSSDILLDFDNLTSRHHAVLKYDREQYVLFDQRSATGVYVNSQKLTVGIGWRLTDGDVITIGDYTLVFYSPRDVSAQDQAPSSR